METHPSTFTPPPQNPSAEDSFIVSPSKYEEQSTVETEKVSEHQHDVHKEASEQESPQNPNLIQLVNASISNTLNGLSTYFMNTTAFDQGEEKRQKQNDSNPAIESPLDPPPPPSLHHQSSYESKLENGLMTSSSNQSIHANKHINHEHNNNNTSIKSLSSSSSSSFTKPPLRTEDSISRSQMKKYDSRAFETFPCTFNLICGSYDALVSDTAVLVKNEESELMGGFTEALLTVLNNIDEERKKKIKDGESIAGEGGQMDKEDDYGVGCSWETLIKLMREQLSKDGYHSVPQLLSTRLIDVKKPMVIINDEYGGFGTRRAVLIGINYVGQKGELKKCHSDVNLMSNYLQTKHGFEKENIMKLMDDGIHINPTKENIINAYRKVAKESKPGDTLFIHYSGHGGHVFDQSGDEENGFDETIIPVDFQTEGQIVDDDLVDELVKPISEGVLVTALMDPHHGGTVMDLPYYFTGEALKRSYDPFENYPAEIFMISGCHDAQESVCTDPKKFLPNPHGKKSGAFTAALLKSLYDAHADGRMNNLSWVKLLRVLRENLTDKGFNQVPQLSSTKVIDINKPLKITTDGTRRAVLIGINYVGKKNALQGCHNDVKNMVEYLTTMQGFKEENMTILMDDGNHINPTYANIMNSYKTIIEQSVAGDTVFLHFSGHGAQIRDLSGDELDGYDETIIPVDFETCGHIVDDVLCNEVVKQFREGVLVTALMDSCHSGTVLDLPYYFNGEGGVDAMERLEQFAFTDIAPVRPCCFCFYP